MATSSLSWALALTLPLFFLAARAKVPPADQFRFVNRGGFLDYRPIEYGATVRGFSPFNDNFRLSFYNTTPNAYTLALRMGNRAQESTLRWVWEANRGDPVHENATLTFGEEGNLVLADADGRVVWQTNTANKGVVGIKVLENGNMVLFDSKGNFVWQSFDFPTDTLMVGQSLKSGGRTKLVSRLSKSINADGPYNLVMEPKRLALYYTTNKTQKPIVYYVYDFFTTIKTQFESMTFQASEDSDTTTGLTFEGNVTGSEFNVSSFLSRPKYNATLSFLRLESDGNVRVYTYDTFVTAQAWEVTYTAFSRDDDDNEECRLPEFCGEFGLCRRSQCNACPTDKGLLGWNETCRPPRLTGCDPKTFHYFKIDGADSFMTKYNRGSAVTEKECGDKCTGDCKCLGFFYNQKSSRCWLGYELKTLIKTGNSSQVAYIKAPNGKINVWEM